MVAMEDSSCRSYCQLLGHNKYPLYVSVVTMLLLTCSSMSRFVLVATNVPMANDIHFGDRVCRPITMATEHDRMRNNTCTMDASLCEGSTKSAECEWYYTGTGYEYQLLAGPLFNVIFSFTGVPVGLILERNRNNRKNVIALCAILWSLMVVFGGLATQYWHLAVTRLAVAFFEAPFTAFAVSLLSSYFSQELRAFALSIFTSGLHIGFSMAFLVKLVANDYGWRRAYLATAIPGLTLGIITYVTIKEPSRELAQKQSIRPYKGKRTPEQTLLPAPLLNPLYITLVLAAAARCGGGRVYGYNINNYIQHYYPGYPTELYLSWIPACMGIISSSVGGIWADRMVMSSKGYVGRIGVLLIGVTFPVPAALLALYTPPPWCFIAILVGAFFHDLIGGIISTVIVEQAPPGRQTSAMTFFVFAINMLGGNLTLLVPALRSIFNWQISMLILWPGSFAVSAILFKWSLRLAEKRVKTPSILLNGHSSIYA
ncbi:uncharacterized protein LOC144440684 [Glandiceps talaboti]